MPTDKQTHRTNVKHKIHKKCGAKVLGAPACRHTAKSNGRCQAHTNLTIPLKQKKDAMKKLARLNKRSQQIHNGPKTKTPVNPVEKSEK